jgi:ribosomal protein S12 methylthiotransferase accessory factor
VTLFLDLGGTIRARSSAETLAMLRPLLSKFGITRVAAHEGLGDGKIPVTVAMRPNARLLSTSQGKGVTRDLADISAIMEAIELHHAERLRPADLVATIADVRKSGKRYLDPKRLNTVVRRRSLYSEDEPISWLELTHLRSGEPVLAPRIIFALDGCAKHHEITAKAFSCDSNGLASGNTLEEALVHGLYEMIERHCIHQCWYNQAREPMAQRSVALDSFRGVPHLDDLRNRLDDDGVSFTLTSLHTELGIPVFGAQFVAVSPITSKDTPFVGWGAHYVPDIAVSRAITEAIQGRITLIAGSRDDVFPATYQDLELVPPPAEAKPVLIASDLPRPPGFTTFSEVLEWTLTTLERHGITDTCYLQHPGEIPVVSMVSPGLNMDLSLVHHRRQDP